MPEQSTKLRLIYGFSWGIAFTVGGYAGMPDFSLRWLAILVVTALLATMGERLAARV